MKLQISRGMWVSITGAVILLVGGKFALDQYFTVPEKEVSIPVPDELYDPRTTVELEVLRFGKLDDQEIQSQCETLMQESGWTHGATLSEILAAGARGQEAEVQKMFTGFLARQAEQYSQTTKDPETVRSAAGDLLKKWASAHGDAAEPDVLDQIGKSAREVIAAGSTDPLIHSMSFRHLSQPLDEAGMKRMAELPDQLASAGYGPYFQLQTQLLRLGRVTPGDGMNRRLIVKEVVRGAAAYVEEYSADKTLDRVNWFILFNVARMMDEGERELLYRRLLTLEKASPYLLHMLAGACYKEKASLIRGFDVASSVADDAWPKIEKLYTMSSLHYRKAWLLRPDVPHAPWAMVEVAKDTPGREHWSSRNWFELTCRAQFDFIPVYTSMQRTLLPRWGGSHEELLAFGQECAATQAFEIPVPYILVECIRQIAHELSDGKLWETERAVKPLTDMWAAMDRWGTEKNVDRTTLRWVSQTSIRAAVLIRNGRYAEAQAVMDTLDGPPRAVSMLMVVRDPQMAASSAYALAAPEAKALIDIEKKFSDSLPRNATEAELDQAITLVSQALKENQAPRATLYLTAREFSLKQQKKFMSGEWVEMPFDHELNHWRVQDALATVESPTSLLLSNLTTPNTTPLLIPRTAFAPPYELQVTLERIRGEQFIDRLAINVGAISEFVSFGEPGGITFVLEDQPRVASTYLPNGGQPQAYYLDGLEDKAMMGLQIWTGQYRCFVNQSLIPLLPVSKFRANSQLSIGGNVWETDTGEVRISNVRIRKMRAPSPPAIDASPEETIEYLTGVVELEPTNVASRLALADLLRQTGRPEECLTQYEEVYKLAPDITRIHSVLGYSFMESGREQETLALLLSASKLNPVDDDVMDRLAWLYATATKDSLRNGSEALRISTEVCNRTQNQKWNFLATQAVAFAELQRFPEAIEVMQKTIAMTPPDQQESMQTILRELQNNRPWRDKATK